MSRPNIIGISAHFHDSACCVLRDGELVAAAEEERFSRVKHDPDLPKSAFRYCLREADLRIDQIDCIAYYEDPQEKLERQLWAALPDVPPRQPSALFRLDARRPAREIRDILGFEGPIEFVDHHQAHAASAYYYSGFDDAAVLTVDGVGEWTTTSYGRASGNDLELFETVAFPHSLGLLYSTLTAYLGFEVNDGEHKMMGLAPYGRPRYVEPLRELVRLGEGGQFELALEYFDFVRGERMYSDKLTELLGRPPRPRAAPLDSWAEDVAHSAQVLLEEILLAKVRYLFGRAPSRHLCMAGGVALNCVANGRILAEGPFDDLFVQPAASDSGGALGAAAIAHRRLTGGRIRGGRLPHVFLGPAYSAADVARAFEADSARVHDFATDEAGLAAAVAERLAAGAVVGWFQGRMEFGPRALGARSILADPRVASMRHRINALVKKREAFRPFAPSVLGERASDHFALDHPSPFMLETCRVRSPLSLSAVTHVDGSARVQTVDAATNPRFHALLGAFDRLTGCPVLLNTSFNMQGEPIVCTPYDALLCFIRSNLDVIVIETLVLNRADVPRAWLERFEGTAPNPPGGLGDAVYTFL